MGDDKKKGRAPVEGAAGRRGVNRPQPTRKPTNSQPESDPVELILSRLEDVKPRGAGWKARCPAHDDAKPSLDVDRGEDGRALLCCRAGCPTEAVLSALGLQPRDLFTASSTPTTTTSRQSTATSKGRSFPTLDAAIASLKGIGAEAGRWLYRDRDGRETMAAVRFDAVGGKQFRPLHHAADGWRIGDPPGLLPLYRLPELLASSGAVFIVEGERCADCAVALGLLATTSAHGSSAARKSDWTPLAGREVVILPDGDTPGERYAADVVAILTALDPPATVRIVELPELPLHGDIIDHVQRRRMDGLADASIRDEVERLAAAAEVVTAEPAGAADGLSIISAADVRCEPVRWLWPGRLPLGKVSIIVGDPGLGKTMLALAYLPAVLTRGWSFPDGAAGPKTGSVLLLSGEDAADDTLVPRLRSAGADLAKVGIIEGAPRDDGRGDRLFDMTRDVDRLGREIIRRGDVQLVCIDPVSAFLGGDADSHRDADVRGVLAPLSKLAERHGVAVVLIMHQSKAAGVKSVYRAVGSIGFAALARAVWLVTKDPQDDGRRLFLAVKMNLAPDPGGLAFRIADAGDGPTVCFEGGRVDVRPDDLERAGGKDREAPALATAVEFLSEFLQDGPRTQRDVESEARGQGIHARTLKRAKAAIGVRSTRPGGAGPWLWSLAPELPDQAGPLGNDGPLGTLGTLAPPRTDLLCQEGQEDHANQVDPGRGPLADPEAAGGQEVCEWEA